MSYAIDKNESWNFPPDYPELLKKSQRGDRHAQTEISKIIYKGIMRYPSQNKRDDSVLFAWLTKINDHDPFEQKVARLFFTAGTTVDAQNTYAEIKEKAEKGDPYAERAMGSLYFYTDLVEISSETGVAWYLKAAKQGHARAQMSLALRYLNGGHVTKNIPEGMKWLKLAVKAGLPEAQATLGIFYYSGENVSKDAEKAFYLIASAAEGGDTKAQQYLAFFYLGAPGLNFSASRTTMKGIYWLKKASDSGDLKAMSIYGDILAQESFRQIRQIGLNLVKKACELGYVDACKAYKKLLGSSKKS